MIRKVGKLIVGGMYMFDGVRCKIESFPTRKMVWINNEDCGNKNKLAKSGRWASWKVSIKEFLSTAKRLPGPNDPQIGDIVIMKDDEMTGAWGYAGKRGTIVGTDPDGDNPDVYAVKLDVGKSIFEVKGVHKSHFERSIVEGE